MKLSDLGEALTPWWMFSGGLNANEDVELAKLRASSIPPHLTQPMKEQPMAVKELAKRGAELAMQYGPQAKAAAENALSRATGGKVSAMSQLDNYVTGPRQLSIATQAIASAGIPVDGIFTADLIGNDRVLNEIRQGAARILSKAQQRFDKMSDNTLDQGPDNTAADVLRKKRVEAVLAQYGSAVRYFLCHPNGGVPAADFAWYKAVFNR